MKDFGSKFLHSVVGKDGAAALAKATTRAPSLETALVPRAIVGWLLAQENQPIDGPIPGVPESHLSLLKNEDSFSGAITIGENVHVFIDETFSKAAAAVAVALGVDARKIDPRIRKADLGNLGKSVDLLIKAELEKVVLDSSKVPREIAYS